MFVVSDDTPDLGWLAGGSGDSSDVADFYDRWAATYEAEVTGWSYAAPSIAARLLREHAPDAMSVLDAGCGVGLVGRAVRAGGHTGVLDGIDVSESSLELARATGAYDTVAQADLQQPLDIGDDSYDALVCVGVMTYVPGVEACWRELARVVRAPGPIVVTQRQDLWDVRECPAVIERLRNDGTWEPELVTEPEPYLPGNDDFGDAIGVHFVVARSSPS